MCERIIRKIREEGLMEGNERLKERGNGGVRREVGKGY